MMCCPNRLAFALAITLSCVFTICAIFSAFWMDQAVQLSEYMMYVHPTKALSFGTYFFGLIQVFVYSYVIGWFFGIIYNGLCGSCDTKAAPRKKK